mmetsp:Transcript_94765/g.237717  ORF Transcript_94765/g.237717 Transcript_94765/m.237717 type:complete len:310 (-) Transcript_94765:388-1317(-)
MRRHQEAQEQRHEDKCSRQHIAQLKHASGAEEDDSDHPGDRQRGAQGRHLGRLLLTLRAIEHHQSAGCGTKEHLDRGVEGIETLRVEDGQVGHGPGCHGSLQQAPGLVIVAIAQLGNQTDKEEESKRAPELWLRLPGQDRQGERQDGRGECECRKEPRRCIPHLGVHGEPSLRHCESKYAVPNGCGPAVEDDIRIEKHRGEQQANEDVQRIVSEHALQNPQRLRGAQQLGARLALSVLRRGVRCHVAAQREEGAHHHVDLSDCLEGEGGGLGESNEVAAHNVRNQEETHRVKCRDADLFGFWRGLCCSA